MPTQRTPVLFLSHGSPLFALDPGTTGPALRDWVDTHVPASALRGIVLMSPHWMTRGVGVMSTPKPQTWHDFGGFPEALYELQYPAAGDPALAQQVLKLLNEGGCPAGADPERPFDHGAWVPLRHMYPEANVPVVQVSLPAHVPPADIYAIGRALASLREQGVLLMGSGGMTHNLRELRRVPGPTDPYVSAFTGWVEQSLRAGDLEAMLDYRARAPHAERAHPSDEHFLPIYFALGAAGWGHVAHVHPEYISREVMFSTLSMAAVSFA